MNGVGIIRWSFCVVPLFGLALGCDTDASAGSDVKSRRQSLAWPGPQFPGAGSQGSSSIAAGVDVLTCGGTGQAPVATTPVPGETAHAQCFYDENDSQDPAATVEWIVEAAENTEVVHVRLTLNPSFVDNSYGQTAIGWTATGAPMGKRGKKGGHTFKDLVGSDHAEFKLSDGAGKLALHFKLDYLSESQNATSGYATLGVVDGEGEVFVGNAADFVAASTSMDRNLNVCGFASYTVDSPATDENYTPNASTPTWDYRVVYDVWVRKAAFGPSGFGSAVVDFVHASPSKAASNTLNVVPGDCPSTWPPYCSEPDGCVVSCEDDPSLPECTVDGGVVLRPD